MCAAQAVTGGECWYTVGIVTAVFCILYCCGRMVAGGWLLLRIFSPFPIVADAKDIQAYNMRYEVVLLICMSASYGSIFRCVKLTI